MMQELTLSQAAQTYGGTLMYPDCHFGSVSTDSRQINEGQLFVALKGEHFDAHQFLPEVATQACGMVVERPAKDINVPQWVVPDTTEALGQIALLNRQAFNNPLVAVTGSSGKTTVKEMIATILRESGEVLATKGNLNNQIGVPMTLLGLHRRHRYAVIEMGASAPGEIAYLSGLARPDVALVTNVLPAHVAGFGSVEGIAKAKGEIYRGVSDQGTAVINLDEPYADQWRNSTRSRVLTYSIANDRADFYAKEMVSDDLGCHHFVLVTPAGEVAVRLPLSGEHNVGNAVAAAACAHAVGAELGMISTGLNKLQPVPGRLTRLQLPSGASVIDDTYNANPGSVKAAINTLVKFRGRHILVLGDMGELGDEEISLHADIGRYAAAQGVESFLAVGPLCASAVQEFGAGGKHFENKEALSVHLKTLLGPDAVVLVKGSRFMAMEDVVQQITKSGEQ
ncbi:MAG: UDP-N-acetylmuramoyl-tripeptide--D-alanyl-D-alanine ligase [Porticoccus sp.]|nr:UDP-N-acetylmuramoyl-tripeptide--D-alanyl-D-alanine ligase [Porticoccus sp.]